MSQPPSYDGIGGKDTENLQIGCLGYILGKACIYGGSALIVLGGIVAVIAALV
jgi:hypothetical protein